MDYLEEYAGNLFHSSEQNKGAEVSPTEYMYLSPSVTSKEEKHDKYMGDTDELLLSTDWDFSDAPSNRGIHSIHPYPAKFIPQIPRKLIELFHPGDSSIILDPFCGSGTTLVEAIDLGLDAWGIDLSPIACLTSRVKTTPLHCDLNEIGRRLISKARRQIAEDLIQLPAIPRIDHWFKPEVQKALAALTEHINREEDLPVREALQAALSSIIVQVSNQEGDTRYAAIVKDVSIEDVLNRFEKAVATVNGALTTLSDNLLRCLGHATVLNQNILTVAPEDLPSNIGLVVTSPPYPNAYEYWLYHKYRMYWLGMDPIEVRRHEIGARAHYFSGKKRQDEQDFERQMGICFRLLAQIMNQGAKACFLVGRSVIHGKVIDNVALLQRASKPYGFVTEGIVKRNIPTTRKTFNPAHGTINEEHLIVFSLRVRS
jgi:DNA modification methylase